MEGGASSWTESRVPKKGAGVTQSSVGKPEASKERLTLDMMRDATRQEIHSLKRENGELKQLVADLSLEVYRLKKRPCR